KPASLRPVFGLPCQTANLWRIKILAQWCRSRHDEPPGFAMLNLTRLHLGIAHESQFQGLGISRAALLLPSASEFGKDKLIARVEEVIQAQIKEQEIEVVDLEVTAVDWTSLIKRAVLRHPPFEAGDKEKGFRDAIVLETFAQLHQKLRLSGPDKQVLLSNDSLLAEATHERMVGIDNVLLVKTWKELETLVSAAAASLQQSAAEKLVERAGLRFQTTFPLNVLEPEISNRNVFQSAPILEGIIRWGNPQFGETALLGVGGRKVVFSTD